MHLHSKNDNFCFGKNKDKTQTGLYKLMKKSVSSFFKFFILGIIAGSAIAYASLHAYYTVKQKQMIEYIDSE